LDEREIQAARLPRMSNGLFADGRQASSAGSDRGRRRNKWRNQARKIDAERAAEELASSPLR